MAFHLYGSVDVGDNGSRFLWRNHKENISDQVGYLVDAKL